MNLAEVRKLRTGLSRDKWNKNAIYSILRHWSKQGGIDHYPYDGEFEEPSYDVNVTDTEFIAASPTIVDYLLDLITLCDNNEMTSDAVEKSLVILSEAGLRWRKGRKTLLQALEGLEEE